MKTFFENENAFCGRKSGQKVGKTISPATTHGSFAKLKSRIQRNTRKYYGKSSAPQFLIRIQARRRREWFELGTDLDVAVKLARDIHRHLHLNGWADTVKKFKPEFAAEKAALTVGRYFELLDQFGQMNPGTLYSYKSKFRHIVGGVRKVKFVGKDKFVGRSKGPSKWQQAVESTLLSLITPEQVTAWRDAYVGRFAAESEERIHAIHTVNSLMRNARAIFAKHIVKRLLVRCPSLALPSPLPFDDIEFIPERESDYFYTSQVDAKQLINDALRELKGNQLAIFVLAIGAGMRRNEIDKLPRAHVDLATGVVTIAPTRYGRLKSDSSVGKIKLEPRFADVLRRHAETTNDEFFLPSPIAPRLAGTHRHYRCKKDFAELCAWLEKKGMTRSNCRIHTLRKEYGSHIADRKGIFAASAGLRHSTIGVTRKYYVSSQIEPTAFFTSEPEVATSMASDGSQLLDMLKKAIDQGTLKLVPSTKSAA